MTNTPMSRPRKILQVSVPFILLLLCPCAAFADGGAPLLLMLNALAFMYGIVAIIAIEAVIQYKFTGSAFKQSVIDMSVVNISSAIVVGGGLGIVVAFFGGILSEMAGEMGTIGLALGTWVIGDSMAREYGHIAVAATIFWLVVSYFATVSYEAWHLNRRWIKREFDSRIPARKLSWLINSLTYGVLIVFFIVAWFGEINF